MDNNNPNVDYQESTEVQPQPQIIYVNKQPERNVVGLVGFILALISLLFDWIPYVGWLVWFLGFLFSFIGMFKKPRAFAVAGFILSLAGLIILLVVIGVIGSIISLIK